ncbi:MAG: hypothetical protein IJF26_02400 [Clostridia bacterium]|nr:hypothetical protein [Clostridia bacterium]
MDKKHLYSYSIMNLDLGHIDEICNDIRDQVESGVCECALFSMTLCPEGAPPADKVSGLCKKYALFRDKLHKMGVRNGILVQASVGHGWILGQMFPFQPHVNFDNGESVRSACHCDTGFREYIYNVMVALAKSEPDCIMIDDDFRTIWFKGEGCACPIHMELFNKAAGTSLTDRELWRIVNEKTPLAKKYTDIYIKTQCDSLVESAKIMRNAVDTVDPTLPMSYCCCGNNAEFAYEIASALAGEGNPVVIRINNGNYTPTGAKGFSRVFHRCATQVAKLQGKADFILAETDTCPQNRYSVSASSLHTHFTGSILEGANGAKHWITRLIDYEPESGVAYRKILSENRGFYEKLAALYPNLEWLGCRIYVPDTPDFTYGRVKEEWDGWSLCVLEKMGIPMYFSPKVSGCVCLEGDVDTRLDDEEIIKILSGSAFIASDTAKNLCQRGFSKYLGVEIREWGGKIPVREFDTHTGKQMKVQMHPKELVPLNDRVEWISRVCNTVDYEEYETLFPGVTYYENELGGRISVFSGTPVAEFNLVEAFSFLTYTRKEQLIRLLKRSIKLPLYCPFDSDVYMKAAKMKDGRIFGAVFNLSLDPMERLQLACDFTPRKVYKLMPDGGEREIDFSFENGLCTLDTECKTLDPVVVFIKK